MKYKFAYRADNVSLDLVGNCFADCDLQLVHGAIAGMKGILDTGDRRCPEGGSDRAKQLVYEMKTKEVERLRSRGEESYAYVRDEKAKLQEGVA